MAIARYTVAVKVIQDHHIFHTTSWKYQYRARLISVYLTCDGFTISIDIVGSIGWFYYLFGRIIFKNIFIRSGSRQLCMRRCRWWGGRCCGWWVWCRCLIIITIIFLNYLGGWCCCSCGIINARWWYLGIFEPPSWWLWDDLLLWLSNKVGIFEPVAMWY